MTPRALLLLILLLPFWMLPARANDGYMAIGTGGLAFSVTDRVAMVSEDLFLSREEVRVRYVFRVRGTRPVTATVGFPLPPILAGILGEDWLEGEALGAMPDAETPFAFTTLVEGRPVGLSRQVRAILPDPEHFASSGPEILRGAVRDITADLAAAGIPFTFDVAEIRRALARLDGATRTAWQDRGWVQETYDGQWLPAWALAITYIREQTFAPGRDIVVEHRYRPALGASVFYPVWELEDQRARYCIDGSTQRGMQRLAQRGLAEDRYPLIQELDYILTTAQTWAEPIGTFTLTVDKGSTDAIVSLCASDIRKVGPTTFSLTRRNFLPQEDIRVLFLSLPPAP